MIKQKEEKKSLGIEMVKLEEEMGTHFPNVHETFKIVKVLEKQMVVLEHLVSIVEELTNKSRFDLK